MGYLLIDQQGTRAAESTLKIIVLWAPKMSYPFYPSASLGYSRFSFSSDFIRFPFLISTLL